MFSDTINGPACYHVYWEHQQWKRCPLYTSLWPFSPIFCYLPSLKHPLSKCARCPCWYVLCVRGRVTGIKVNTGLMWSTDMDFAIWCPLWLVQKHISTNNCTWTWLYMNMTVRPEAVTALLFIVNQCILSYWPVCHGFFFFIKTDIPLTVLQD